jgi:hypothetical protein
LQVGNCHFNPLKAKKKKQRERERERERKFGVVMRDTTLGGGGQETISPVLKVPRQCPLVLLV